MSKILKSEIVGETKIVLRERPIFFVDSILAPESAYEVATMPTNFWAWLWRGEWIRCETTDKDTAFAQFDAIQAELILGLCGEKGCKLGCSGKCKKEVQDA